MDSKVQNTMNDFLMLSNNQFIENVSLGFAHYHSEMVEYLGY